MSKRKDLEKALKEMPVHPDELSFDYYLLPQPLEPMPETMPGKAHEDDLVLTLQVTMRSGKTVPYAQLTPLDEAAARLLTFSVEAGRFRAVSWMEVCRRLAEELDGEADEAPFSIYRLTGPEGLTDGFGELVAKGYAARCRSGKEDAGWLLFPTRKLVDAVVAMRQ